MDNPLEFVIYEYPYNRLFFQLIKDNIHSMQEMSLKKNVVFHLSNTIS